MDQNDQSTPRHCFAKFLEQVLTSRTASRQKRSSSDTPSQPSTIPKVEEQPQQPTMNNYPETGEQFPEQNDRIVNQFSLHPSDHLLGHRYSRWRHHASASLTRTSRMANRPARSKPSLPPLLLPAALREHAPGRRRSDLSIIDL